MMKRIPEVFKTPELHILTAIQLIRMFPEAQAASWGQGNKGSYIIELYYGRYLYVNLIEQEFHLIWLNLPAVGLESPLTE